MKIVQLMPALLICLISSAHVIGAYPERPIRVIVPFPPGGNIDLTARILVPGMSSELGQSVIIDNRGGANGLVGQEIASKSTPDGYTLVLTASSSLTTTPALSGKRNYDPTRDFAPITLTSNVPLVMVVRPSLPVKTVQDFITFAKSNSGKTSMASGGSGSTAHLTGALFQSLTGTKLIHVAYKGGGPAEVDLMGGHVDVFFDQLSSAVGLIHGGKLRALAVTTRARSAEIPDVPTMAEAGVPGCEASITSGILAPAATPPNIVNRLRDAIIKVLRTKAVRDSIAKLGAETVESTPQEFAKFLKEDNEKWAKVIRVIGLTAE